jgi:hypothetical protein
MVAEPNNASDRRGLAISLALSADLDALFGKPHQSEIQEAVALSELAVANDPANVKVKEEQSEIQTIVRRWNGTTRRK